MYSLITSIFRFLLLTLVAGSAARVLENKSPDQSLNARACTHNNCLRALLSPVHSSAAVSFCETYIPAVTTITLHSTRIFTATFLDEATQPFTTVTTVTTVTSPSVIPRAATTATLPTFLSACEYDATSISSACSCFVAPIATEVDVSLTFIDVYEILTLPTQTVTQTMTVTVT